MARTVVTGSRGRLAGALLSLGCTALDADLKHPALLKQAYYNLVPTPDALVLAAACTDVDACEEMPVSELVAVNVDSVRFLADLHEGYLVLLSTDYVFGGERGPYRESDERYNPRQMYGWSKLGAEMVLRGRPDTLIVRTTHLFDEYRWCWVHEILSKLLEGETVYVVDYAETTPTYTPDLADGILRCIEREETGIVNLTGNWTCGLGDLASHLQQRVGSGKVEVRSFRANRPVRGGLDSSYARSKSLMPRNSTWERLDQVVTKALDKMPIREGGHVLERVD